MAIRYREFAVHEALAPYVRLIWLLECDGQAVFGGPERIVADGVVEAIFHYRTPFTMRFADADAARQPVSLLVSQTRRFVEIEPAGAGGFIAVRFHPWGAHQFLPVAVRDVADRATPADEVWRRPEVRETEERIGTAATDAERVDARMSLTGRLSLLPVCRNSGTCPLTRHASGLLRSRPIRGSCLLSTGSR